MCYTRGWRGGAASPLRTPGGVRPFRAGGRAVTPLRRPLLAGGALPNERRTVRAPVCRRGGLDGRPAEVAAVECARLWRAGHVAPGCRGAVVPVASVIAVLPLP